MIVVILVVPLLATAGMIEDTTVEGEEFPLFTSVRIFSKSINELLQNDSIEIPDYKDDTIATYGLKYIAEESGCKSGYLFAVKTIDGKFIGTLGLDYTKRKTKLDMESINHLQNHAASIGGVLMTYLQQ